MNIQRIAALLLLLVTVSSSAKSSKSDYDGLDLDRTLRTDYIFSGTDKTQEIALAQLHVLEGWAGRRVNMNETLLRGNGQIEMRVMDSGSGEFDKVVYRNSFSTLFQEWQATEEAAGTRRSFENSFLLPMPSRTARITVRLYDFHDRTVCEFSHIVDPGDILIRPEGSAPVPHEWIWKGGSDLSEELDPENRIDVAIVAEG